MISILRVLMGEKYNIQDPVAALNKDTETMRESKEMMGGGKVTENAFKRVINIFKVSEENWLKRSVGTFQTNIQ